MIYVYIRYTISDIDWNIVQDLYVHLISNTGRDGLRLDK